MKDWKALQPTDLACFLAKRIMFQSQNRVGKIRLLTLRFVGRAGSCGCRSCGRLLTFLAVRVVQFLIPLCTFMIGTNVFRLCVRAGFGAQNCQPALHLNRSTKLQVCTTPRLTQNPCYRAFFLFSPFRCHYT